jgi:hypothetical protein
MKPVTKNPALEKSPRMSRKTLALFAFAVLIIAATVLAVNIFLR